MLGVSYPRGSTKGATDSLDAGPSPGGWVEGGEEVGECDWLLALLSVS